MKTVTESKKVQRANRTIQKEKDKARAKYAESLELHTKKPLTKNGWFALALSIAGIVAAVAVLFIITVL